MKVVYMYDTVTRIFKGSKTIDDDNYVVQAGETLIEPSEGLYDPKKFSADGTEWVGTDKEVWQAAQDEAYQEYLKEHPEDAPQPTAEQQQLSDLIKSNVQQMALNAQLIKQITELQSAKADTTQEAE